ncbi:sulfate/molybdate ABC transporter ATP-binding protein [Bosea sp. BIWAKO-01]|uniref:sulfate/molybdate ABC transporter ATP-binding protein n=1 Tax=Bosea sp. BIWAKO-01 TaxID=506668 RepID=UPI0008533E2A|nr:sulfate/molybdate ABC transporter ATP-binding protein [Bosea sp. BIWAKO-01]GAU85069.1 sulfate and thiosulfate import ATP-binding protein cysA [Bosea sp. BIWAKO-01]
MSVAVTIESVQKTFSNFPALRGVSLDVQPGELVALLGPSGSGKTTLLRLIAGLEQADDGRVLFDETDTRRLSLRERRIGFVFQHYALFRHMDVAANIAFGLKARPRSERPSASEISRRVSELLELVQLGGLERRFPTQLSGGQRQRVALARALAIEPRVLLLDEPFGALDAKVRKDLRSWLRDLHRRTGHTTLFVTHDQEEALELADRVAILHDGRLEQVGSPDDVYDHPATPFVCEFLGEANKLPVEVVGGQAFFGNRPVLGGLQQNQGGAASLYVRPQHMRIVDDTPLALPGVVEDLRRNGPLRRAEIAVEGLIRRIDVDLASQVAPAIGERVRLRITHGSLFAAA